MARAAKRITVVSLETLEEERFQRKEGAHSFLAPITNERDTTYTHFSEGITTIREDNDEPYAPPDIPPSGWVPL